MNQTCESSAIRCFFNIAIILASTLFGVSPSVGQVTVEAPPPTSQSHASSVSGLLEQYYDYGQFNGTVLVVEDGETIVRQGFGMANMEWEIPNSPETKFRIGSVTKQFTAALILQLAEEEMLELDAPITKYLTNYRKDTGDKFTVHHLLCHTSGVPSYTTGEFFKKHSREPYELDEFVKKFASGDLEFEPGSQFNYSNSGYHLLGAIIEAVTGQAYAEVLSERILKPVGMSDSGFDVSAIILKKRAQGYSKTPDGYVNADYLDMGIPYSAGSMYSTVDDLLKWHEALRNDELFSAESKELMHTPNLRNYGYGVDVDEHKIGETGETTRVIAHGGGINGFNCLLTRAVDQNHIVVILDNVGMGNHHSEIATSILNILNDQPFDGPKKSLADELSPSIEEGADAIVARYRDLKNNQPDTYDFGNEEALNQLGYQFFQKDRIEDAIKVFQLNVEMFPESFNPYDSLGEAYLKNDQKELALTNYKKSVELNPVSQSGILAIQKLEGKEVKVDHAILETYIGEYQIRPGFDVVITVEDGALMGEPTGQPKITLESLSETTFVVPSVKANITFVNDDVGKVTELILKQNGQEIHAQKAE